MQGQQWLAMGAFVERASRLVGRPEVRNNSAGVGVEKREPSLGSSAFDESLEYSRSGASCQG